MLWLCLLPLRLPLEALDAAAGADIAVVQSKGNRRWVIDSVGTVAIGTPLSAALALHPLRVLERKRHAEREALLQLAYFAYSLGSPVHLSMEEPRFEGGAPFHAVWVEVSASLTLFKGLSRLRKHVRAAIATQTLTVAAGLAPTIESSVLAAQAGVVLDTPARLRRWLVKQPIGILRLPQAAIDGCRASGMRTAGEVLAVPADALARRFKPIVPDYLRRLLGEAPDPRPSIVPPPRFRRRFELFGVIETKEELLIPLRRLLVELEHYLRARDAGVLGFSIELTHEDHSRSMVEVGLSTAVRDANHFLLIARERLERAQLPSGVTELLVRAETFSVPDTAQRDLFDGTASQQREWTTVIEKLKARWGEEAIWSLGVAADHRPERGWHKVPPGIQASTGAYPSRPLWLLPKPHPISRPTLVGRPERITAGWWETGIDRDYFVAKATDGTHLWVFQDRASRDWHLHGFWS